MWQIGPKIPIGTNAGIGRGHQQVLTTVAFIHRRNPAACGSERALPQLLPGLGIIDVKLVIASGNEDQPGDSWNDAELEIARSAGSRDAKARQPRIISERNLPFDRALVQVVRRQRRVGWPDDI